MKIRKRQKLFDFSFLEFEIDANRLSFEFYIILTHSFQKCMRGTKKSSQTWKSRPNIAKSNRVFPEKGRGDQALSLKYLDSPMAKVFPTTGYIFSIQSIYREKWVVKVGPKAQTLDPSLFHGNSNPSTFFQTMLLFARVLPLVRMWAILDHILGNKDPKTSQKRLFHRCWIKTKNFENV